MTKNHKPGGLEQQKFILSESGGQKSDSKVRQGRALSEGSRGSSVLASSSSWGLLAVLGVPRLVDVSLQSLPLSSRGFPCVSVYEFFSSYKDTDHWIRACCNPA